MDELTVIARIHTDFPAKFGLPRQSGLVEGLTGLVVFEPQYRSPDLLRGIEAYSRIWLLWGFSLSAKKSRNATVRPPRLGGNERMGVFATRSPFRPNPIGLSAVKLLGIRETREGAALLVSGIDMADGTPIYDIKPYLPYADSYPNERAGFSDAVRDYALRVAFPEELLEKIPEEKRAALTQVLQNDPRPGYQDDAGRVYGFTFAGREIRFRVEGEALTVVEVE